MTKVPEPLRVVTQRGEQHFPAGENVVIGRDPAASVALTYDKVSRRHLTVAFEPVSGWVATDASANGTYHDGARVSRLVLDGPVALMLGNPVDGEPIQLVVGAILPAAAGPANASIGQFSMVHQPERKTRIGRSADNDIVVNDLLASRNHAELDLRRARWLVHRGPRQLQRHVRQRSAGSAAGCRSPTAPWSASRTTCSA